METGSSPPKLRVFGVFAIVLSLVLGYFVLLRPLLEAQRTGVLRFSLKAVLVPPAFFYLGVAVMVTDLRDGTIREAGPDGRPRFTRKGRVFLAGLVVVLTGAVAAWYGLLHLWGFGGG